MSGWERGDDRVERLCGEWIVHPAWLAIMFVRSMLCSTEGGLNVKDSI